MRLAAMFLFLVAAIGLAGLSQKEKEPPASPPWKYLSQGWTDKERKTFYTTPQGSYLIPYEWFLHLEQAANSRLFRADDNIERLRYLSSPADPHFNPDGLPVGFVKEPTSSRKETPETHLLNSFYQRGTELTDMAKPRAWLGLTCAACHTTELQMGSAKVRVDGAPTLADFTGMIAALEQSIAATLVEDDKFKRFADNVLGKKAAAKEKDRLYVLVDAYHRALRAYADRNHPLFARGFGRLDAFGLIMNETFGTALRRPDNYRPADAPVSYPDLWLTPELTWVQWNGSAANPFGRNVGEVLGVFGHVDASRPSADGFASSIRGKNLYDLEQLVRRLKPPAWDENLLGKIDPDKAKKGAAIYAKDCAKCHANKPPYPRTKPNQYGKTFITVTMIPLAEIGTDPKMATNFATRKARPGVMGQPTDPPSPALPLLLQVVGQVVQRQFKDLKLTPEQKLAYSGYRSSEHQSNLLAYRAKPLAGVWATAPYLHNGSVPNLYELLLPPARRKRTFFVGCRKFDPTLVGLSTEKVRGAFLLDTGLPGNSNAGHTYGTGLTDEQRWDLLEYLKTL